MELKDANSGDCAIRGEEIRTPSVQNPVILTQEKLTICLHSQLVYQHPASSSRSPTLREIDLLLMLHERDKVGGSGKITCQNSVEIFAAGLVI